MCLMLAGIHCAIVGLFVATEDDSLSRRIRRGLPRRRLARLLIAPLLPGGSRGLLYLVLHLATLCLFAAAIRAFEMTSLDASLRFSLGIAGYIVVYVGGGATLGRWCRAISTEVRPAHARVFSVLLLLAGLIAPYIPIMAGKRVWQGYTLWHISNPFESLDALQSGSHYSNSILLLVGVGAGLVIVANIGAMRRGIAEIFNADVPERGRTSDS